MSVPLTIGLPVYNGENYVAEAIASLQEQTFTDFRLIIADNASTDATEDICREAADDDDRIEYHRHRRNLGAAANYNFAVDASESSLFMWQAHDDLRGPKFLELAVEAHRQRPSCSIVFSKARIIGPRGELGEDLSLPSQLTSPDAARRLHAAITCRTPDVVLFGVMKRELLLKTGKHGNFKGGDRLLVAEMALLGDFLELGDVLFFNRDHPDRYVRMKDSGGTREAKASWWDTSAAGAVSMPRWKGFFGYLKAVARHAPGGWVDKASAYWSVFSSLWADRFYLAKQLARDAASGAYRAGRVATGATRRLADRG